MTSFLSRHCSPIGKSSGQPQADTRQMKPQREFGIEMVTQGNVTEARQHSWTKSIYMSGLIYFLHSFEIIETEHSMSFSTVNVQTVD